MNGAWPFSRIATPSFGRGAHFAAWLGLVPKQESTGGKQTLLSISMRGNHYLRRLFVSGARAVLQCRDKQPLGLSAWLGQMASRVHGNVAAVALANKLARFAWAVLAQKRGLSASSVGRLDGGTGLQLTPGKRPGLEIAARFPQSQTSDDEF